MALVVGIDEAGYGPTLGPLVAAASVWRVASEQLKCDFWNELGDCVCKHGGRGEWRLVINDSKTVYDRKRGLATLERPLLACLRAADAPHATLLELLRGCGVNLATALPWYEQLASPLPIDARAEDGTHAIPERLSVLMRERGIELRRFVAEVITEPEFNARVAQTRNKAAALVERILRIVLRAAQVEPDDPGPVVIRVDRLGGRTDYRHLLQLAFPDRDLTELARSDAHSRYRLTAAGDAREWFVEFAAEADCDHLPVALASMLAKYIRECTMAAFNAFWRRFAPDLKPTAGYYVDAQRFLREIEPHLEEAGVARSAFVRAR